MSSPATEVRLLVCGDGDDSHPSPPDSGVYNRVRLYYRTTTSRSLGVGWLFLQISLEMARELHIWRSPHHEAHSTMNSTINAKPIGHTNIVLFWGWIDSCA